MANCSQRAALTGSAPTHTAVGRVFFYGPQDRGDLRPATCELRSFFIACMRYVGACTWRARRDLCA